MNSAGTRKLSDTSRATHDTATPTQTPPATAGGTQHHRLPADLLTLEQCGVSITELHLTIDRTDARDGINNDAIRRGIAACPQLRALTVRFNDPALEDVQLSRVCETLVASSFPITSLQVSLERQAALSYRDCFGTLCRKYPEMQLICEGKAAACSARGALAGGAASGVRLTVIGVESTHAELVQRLIQLGQSDLCVDIHLLDHQADAFMQGLMAAGVSSTLRLTVHTTDGYSVGLQDRLAGLQHTHLSGLLASCLSSDKALDTAALLEFCQQQGSDGPLLFSLACRAAASAGAIGLPQVPMAHAPYLRALHNAGVNYVAICVLPHDREALENGDKATVVNLRLDVREDPRRKGNGVFLAPVALAQLKGLKTLVVQCAMPPPQFGWPLSNLAPLQLETLHLHIEGPAVVSGGPGLATFLKNAPLVEVVCEGVYAASSILTSLQRTTSDRASPLRIKLVLPSESERQVADWMDGIHWPWLHLDIHFAEDVQAKKLKALLAEKLSRDDPPFSIGQLDISSQSHAMPADDPLLLTMARHNIKRLLPAASQASRPQNAVAQASIDKQSVLEAFRAHIDPTNTHVLRDPFRHVMAEWLNNEAGAWKHLSSVNSSTRSHTSFNEQFIDKVMPWVRHQQAHGRPATHYGLILARLYGEKFARQMVELAERNRY